MFKKTEESEWTRFSKALGGKEQPREPEDITEPTADVLDDEPSVVAAPPPESSPGPMRAAVAPPLTPRQAAPPMATPESREAFAEGPVLAATPPSPITQQPEPLTVPASRSVESDDRESVIAEGTEFEGTFRSEHSIRVRGKVQGEIASKQAIVVEANARVNAKVSAEQVTILGEVNGEVTCPGRVEISPNGRVTGEITAGALVMQEGAFFEGQLKMSPKGSEQQATVDDYNASNNPSEVILP